MFDVYCKLPLVLETIWGHGAANVFFSKIVKIYVKLKREVNVLWAVKSRNLEDFYKRKEGRESS